VLSCGAAGAGSFLLVALQSETEEQFPAEKKASPLTLRMYLQLALSWLAVLVVLSVPTALYALSRTLPSDNTLGLSEGMLLAFNELAVFTIYVMIVAVMPALAPWLVQRVTQRELPDPTLACRMLLLGRIFVNMLVPTVVVMIFDNRCSAQWLHFWSPCANHPHSFDVTVSMEPSLDNTPPPFSPMHYFLSLDYPHAVATHAEICEPSWSHHQQCLRGVLAVLFDLIFAKLVFLAILAPGATLLLSLPSVTRLLRGIWQRVHPSADFVWFHGDVELAFVLMFVEYILALGFLMPLLLPLCALGLTLNTAVYHMAVEKLNLPVINAARPSSYLKYLYISRALGITLTILFYMESDLHGKLLVCIGMPLSAIAGNVAATYLSPQSMLGSAMPSLIVPLLGPDEGVLERCIWSNSSENGQLGNVSTVEMGGNAHGQADSAQSCPNDRQH